MMSGVNILKNGFEGDSKLQQREDEGLLEWIQRIDAIEDTEYITAVQKTNARLTNYMWPSREETGMQTRKRASSLFSPDN